MKTLLLSLATLTFSATTFAGDIATYKNLGFSKNNAYYSFMEYGEQDGSGFAYASLYIVNVKENTMAAQKSVVLENDQTPDIAKAVKTAMKSGLLEKFGISEKNPGTFLVNRTRFDRSEFKDTKFTVNPTSYSLGHEDIYSVLVNEKIFADNTEGKWCSDMSGKDGKIGMQVALQLEGSDNKIVLQDDKAVPESRGCPLSYSVEKVIKSGDAVVVMVKYSAVGFEGPDARFLAITGNAKL